MKTSHTDDESQVSRCVMAWGFVVAVMLSSGLTLGACDSDSGESKKGDEQTIGDDASTSTAAASTDNDNKGSIEQIEGDAPQDDTVIARSGSIEVTFGQYVETLARVDAMRGKDKEPLSKRQKANPRMQIQTARRLLRQKVLERIADNHDVSIEETAVDSHLRNHDRLGRLVRSSGSSDAGTTGDASEDGSKNLVLVENAPPSVDLADLREMARQELLQQRLRDRLIEVTDEETVWRWYRQRQNRTAIIYVRTLNVPISKAIDTFVKENPDAIESHYESNKENYQVPRMVEVVEIAPSESTDGSEQLKSALKRAAERLASGDSASSIVEEMNASDDQTVKWIERGPRTVGPSGNKKATEMAAGETGWRMKGERAPHAWRVEKVHDAGYQDLDTSLQRQIASELLQEKGVVPSVRRSLNDALEIMRSVDSRSDGTLDDEARGQVTEKLKSADYKPTATKLFRRDTQGVVPGVGIAESVSDLAFSLDGDQPVAEEPVVARQHAYAVRLLDRERPSRDTFDDNKASIRADFEEAMRDRVISEAVDEWFKEHPPKLEMKPVRIKYGRLRKPER